MRSLLLLLLLLSFGLLPGVASAQELAVHNGASAEVVPGEIVIRFAGRKGDWPPAVGIVQKPAFSVGKKITVTFEARSLQAISARLVVSDAAPPHTHRMPAQSIQLSPEWKPFSLTYIVNAAVAAKVNLPMIAFDSFPTSGEVRLRNLKTSEIERNWKPLDISDLYIKPGTALDFSPHFDQAPAGTYGRVIVNKKGELTFASRPDTAVRFFSVQLTPPQDFTLWTDQDIVDYAAAVSRQGYNMVRFHFFDTLINGNYKAAALKKAPSQTNRYTLPEKPEDIVFDAYTLSRFQLLLAELKKRGVYWNLDFMSSFVGYSNNKIQDTPKQGCYNTKVQMYVNPNFRANWKAAATRLLHDVNPYTGLAMKDDPALALAQCLNEQEIIFEYRDYGREFDGIWHAYLTRKYGTYHKMREAWAGKCGVTPLPESGAFTDLPPIAAPTVLSDTPAGHDMAQCCSQIEYEMAQWFQRTLGEIGFAGLASNYNMRSRIGTVPARSLFPLITMNDYHAHPHYGPQVAVNQRSSLAEGGASFKSQAMARFLDRPFANTEFGHVFWNPYRHEQGLLHGAGAALQNWSALTCHAGQVQDSGLTLSWFHAGDDPVIRASEAVEALVFRRGDVAASPHTIEIPLNDAFIHAGRGMKAIDDELSRLWVLCRVGITYGPRLVDYPAVLSVSPDKMASIGGSIWFSDVAKSDETGRLVAIVRKLKELLALPATNESDPAAGILQSDTGEVTLNIASGGEILIRTPRFEGAVLKGDRQVKLGAVTIETCNVPASLSVASLDVDKTAVSDAYRLLLVIATDARNSNMTFAGADEGKVVSLGTLPVLARTGIFKLRLTRSAPPKSATAYALKLNGERAEPIPVVVKGNTLSLSIDTATLKQAGPTPFFEIIVEPASP